MKYIYLGLIFLVLSCKSNESVSDENAAPDATAPTPVAQGQKLFEGKGNCTACHQPDQKIIGPSLKEISGTYKAKKGSIVNFLREKDGPIVDPAQYEAMKVNFAVTDRMSEAELKALEAYILSH